MKTTRQPAIVSPLIIFVISILTTQIVRAAVPAQNLSVEEKEKILSATVQFIVYSADGATFEQGIGSLFSYAGETLILTHNHWTKITDFAKVEIRSAQNVLLLEISGHDFLGSVYYRDQGSIILKAPTGLSLQMNAGISGLSDLHVKDNLALVHQSNTKPGILDVMLAGIQTIVTDRGVSSYKITIQDGEEIIPGDSGGGVWFNGQLVGNTWAYYQSDATQIGIIAQLPVHYLDNYLASFRIEETDPLQADLSIKDGEAQLHRGEDK